jgi:lysophospholipase L1-like esterase
MNINEKGNRMFSYYSQCHKASKGLVFLSLLFITFFLNTTAFADETCDQWEELALTTPAPPSSAKNFKRYHHMLERFPEKADVLFFGDSLAAGWSKKATKTAFMQKHVGNIGFGGSVVQTALWALENAPVELLSPKTIVLLLGTNNLKRNSACAIGNGMVAVVNKLHFVWPSAIIYIIDIPPRGKLFNEHDTKRIEVNRALAKLPETYNFVQLINGFDDKITCKTRPVTFWQQWFPNQFPDVCENYKTDNLHLSSSGYDLISLMLKQRWINEN